MRHTYKIVILLTLWLIAGCSEDTIDLVGMGTITGRIVESDSFNPIENAKITLSPTNNTIFSDADGYFSYEDVEEGDYSVSAIKEGYLTNFEAATVTADINVNVIFEMDYDTALNKSPSRPELVTPEDGSEDQELSVQLIWESEDPEGDPIIYSLEIKNDYDNNVIKVESLADTTYVVTDLKYGVKYFWQVGASDDINPEVFSLVSTFKTKVNPENRFFYTRKSANGNNIIYSSTYNDATSEVDNEVLLTTEDQNSWRPRKNQASNLVAFLRTANNQTHIFTMNQDGSDVRQVTSSVSIEGFDMNKMDYSWSSNGDRFIYPSYDKLYVINKDGSGLQQIYQTADGSFITECDWSNDESMIALKTNDITGYNARIFTIDSSGNITNTILSGISGAAGGINISVDNKLLLYTYDITGYENADNRQLNTHMFIYKFADASVVDISTNKVDGTNDLDPRFSPNEAEVIFVNTSNDGLSTNYIYKSAGQEDSDRTEMFIDATMPDWE